MARVAGAVFGPTILKGQFFNLMKEKITSTSCDFYPWSFSLITEKSSGPLLGLIVMSH
jgi:hypothetical protein